MKIQKFSIIVPVHNEPKEIIKCLRSLNVIDYNKKKLEILIINDGSTDETENKIEKYIKHKNNFKLLNNKSNQGRSRGRIIGAKMAKYNNLIFVDSRVTIEKSLLRYLNTKKEQIIIAGDKGYKRSNNIFEAIISNFKKILFKKNFPQKENIIKITAKNFDHIGKGTTACYIKKNLFIKATKHINNTKDSSDDIKLFTEILKLTNFISRDNKFKINYNYREKLLKILVHTFNRGPKFVDYYWQRGKRFFPHLLIIYILTLANFFFIINPIFFLYELATFILATIITAIYISQTSAQFLTSLYFLPLIAVSFYFGLIKGIIIKLIK